MKHPNDTIFAQASGKGRSGVAVIRLSGPDVRNTLEILSGPLAQPRVAALRSFWSGDKDPTLLDRGLVLFFPAPKSFTGEDVGELHLHGSFAVIQAVFKALLKLGLRPAEPGEFTRRAFDFGKLDLTEVEGLADLLAAQTESQRVLALNQMGGALSEIYESWRGQLVSALAQLEAEIDFADEELPDGLSLRVMEIIETLQSEMVAHLSDRHRGERLRDGVSVVILGPPNVGKSSLLNSLAQRDVAIVSDQSGTTRDIIEVHLDLTGIAVNIADTAGLRRAKGDIELEGVRRAIKRAEQADIRIYLDSPENEGAEKLATAFALEIRDTDLRVMNKSDLLSNCPGDCAPSPSDTLLLSVKTGDGMEKFLSLLTERVQDLCGSDVGVALTRARHRHAVEASRAALDRFLKGKTDDVGLRAEDIRIALRSLGRIVGRVDVEEVLGLIFSEFCIGK